MSSHQCDVGHRVSDGKVSEWKLREILRTRKYQCYRVYMKKKIKVPCLVLKCVYIYIYISPLLLVIVAFIVALVLLL